MFSGKKRKDTLPMGYGVGKLIRKKYFTKP
jgi:hypothetical protein